MHMHKTLDSSPVPEEKEREAGREEGNLYLLEWLKLKTDDNEVLPEM